MDRIARTTAVALGLGLMSSPGWAVTLNLDFTAGQLGLYGGSPGLVNGSASPFSAYGITKVTFSQNSTTGLFESSTPQGNDAPGNLTIYYDPDTTDSVVPEPLVIPGVIVWRAAQQSGIVFGFNADESQQTLFDKTATDGDLLSLAITQYPASLDGFNANAAGTLGDLNSYLISQVTDTGIDVDGDGTNDTVVDGVLILSSLQDNTGGGTGDGTTGGGTGDGSTGGGTGDGTTGGGTGDGTGGTGDGTGSDTVVVSGDTTIGGTSVLERVLSRIDGATNLARVNGTYVNIAANVGSLTLRSYYVDADGGLITPSEYAVLLAGRISTNLSLITTDGSVWTFGQTDYATEAEALAAAEAAARAYMAGRYTYTQLGIAPGIDGSISNVVHGITDATQQALVGTDVSALEWNMPTLVWGDMSTTVLGAVNTGDITLGINQSVEEAKTTSTAALRHSLGQIGGSADTGALVLNVASNMSGVNGSIRNLMLEVNGTVGDLSTTVLGAVNSGTITSGVNGTVQGIVGLTGTPGL